jgi:TPR repeat protein
MGLAAVKKILLLVAASMIVLGASAMAGGGLPVPGLTGSHTPEAARLWRAAALGNARAQTQLGYMYQQGLGVPQDYGLAAKWYHLAAEQGEPHAQHLLGLLFDKGFGVPIDFTEAYKWLNLAAAGAPPRDRDYYTRIRDAVASKLPYGQTVAGQLRSRYWWPLPER